MKALVDWLDDRASIRAVWSWFADQELPGGARLRYSFGSVLVFLVVQQAVLGILLASYYSPSATDAWASVEYLNDQVTAGWFLRGLHHHGSSAVVVMTVLHVLQTALAGAYRKPRELNWLSGLVMAAPVLGFALTGYLLPWDQKGYWATQVATSILGSMPGGAPLRVLLQGGTECGNLTLTRFFTLHVFVLPIALFSLLAVHIALVKKHGVTPPELPKAELEQKKQRYFPSQLFWDVLLMALTSCVLVLLTFSTHGATLYAPAQPASNFQARPEWYFLPLFQLLKYFEGPTQFIGTAVIPGALAAFLAGLPWIDRAQSRKMGERMPVVAGLALIMSGIIVLITMALHDDAKDLKYQKAVIAQVHEGTRSRELAKAGVLPQGGDAVFENDPQVAARRLFKDSCENCHTLEASGGEEAPNLTQFKDREWLSAVIRNPHDKRFFGGTKTHKEMEPYAAKDLPDAKLKPLVEYLYSIQGDGLGPVDAALAAQGQKLFADDVDCNTCHEVKPGETSDGPNLFHAASKDWIVRVIRDSSAPDLFGKVASMPSFKKKLSDDDIQKLAELITSQTTNKGGT